MSQSVLQGNPRRRWLYVVAAAVLVLLSGVLVGESLGWPFLATPLQHQLSSQLERSVRLTAHTGDGRNRQHFKIRFIGGLRLYVPTLEIAAPTWSEAPHMLQARELVLELRYWDLWRVYRGQRLRIQYLQAAFLDGELERLADGRASWQVTPATTPAPELPAIPFFGHLQIDAGTLRYRDAIQATDLEARLSLVKTASPTGVLQLDATGTHHKLPLKIELRSSGAQPSAASPAQALPVAVKFDATLGRASMHFEGSVSDALHFNDLRGHFGIKGSSLAAVGDLVGVTLPTTGVFSIKGDLVRAGDTWHVVLKDATVGDSRLNGDFTYATGQKLPLLTGRLEGSRLLLVDLGPALGVASDKDNSADVTRGAGMVLPDRRFNLPALRAMNADISIDIREVDLHTRFLEPLRPLRGHLQLADGVLTLKDLDARTAQGQLQGGLSLDGRGSLALWRADLRWDGVQLEHWIRQGEDQSDAPLIAGRLKGRVNLKGQGRSTAEILASLDGRVRTELHDGAISHLMVEAAGLDLAQALGVLIKGRNNLSVQCAVADLMAERGVFRPQVMVLDTSDSVVFIDGSLSLAAETLNLRAVVSPKGFSPLTLRAPLRVHGSFADPELSLQKRSLGLKLGGAFLLALVNPLAALIPLIDIGDAPDARRGAAACQALIERAKPKPVATAAR